MGKQENFDIEEELYLDEEENEDGPKKVAAEPIPEIHYNAFKDRLLERSIDCPERNITLFYVGVATGYRLGDIVGLRIGDIKRYLEAGKFTIQESKGYKAWEKEKAKNPNSKKKVPAKRETIIQPKLRKILRDYIKGKRNSQYAFENETYKDRHISAKGYSKILKDTALDIDIDHITGHSLRKTYATRLYKEKNDLEFVRRALGHKSIETTKVYLGLENEIKEDASRIADSKL